MTQEFSDEYISTTFLPVKEMLQLTKVVKVENQSIVCEQQLSEGNWVFPLHFPNDPIFPGSLMIEAAGQAIAIWAWENGLRGKPRLVKCTAEFKHPVSFNDSTIIYKGKVTKRGHICFGSVDMFVGDCLVGVMTGTVVIIQE